ncbi:hypothetical protein DFH09DRAFT_1311572 [Mycena vulgaris]|nr:hypothetical protein DFH09DRAFT_1311572 [Mycena vulgaris]
MQRALDRYDEGITPVHIYDIDQLQAMRLAALAWQEVTKDTIANCWQKAGILPTADAVSDDDRSDAGVDNLNVQRPRQPHTADPTGGLDPAADAQAALSRVLDELQKEQVIEDATDEEIFEAVKKMCSGEQNRELNGGNDDEEDEPTSTRKEALQAAATLRKFIADVDEPFARKMEAIFVYIPPRNTSRGG